LLACWLDYLRIWITQVQASRASRVPTSGHNLYPDIKHFRQKGRNRLGGCRLYCEIPTSQHPRILVG